MIGKKRVSRKLDLPKKGGELIDLPPGWEFTVVCSNHGSFSFDFSPFRRNGRDELAAQMRDAIWSMRFEVQGITLEGYVDSGLVRFWNFLDELHAAGRSILRLNEIDEALIKQFIAWTKIQITPNGSNKGKPWTLATCKTTYDRVKTVLVNRKKKVPTEVSKNLSFPKNPYPQSNHSIVPRSPYSEAELERILAAINSDLRFLDREGDDSLSPLSVLTLHLLAVALATGRNLQSLLDLRIDSLKPSPFNDREILITEKRRGYSTHVTSYRKSSKDLTSDNLVTIPRSVGDYIRFLHYFTDPLREEADEKIRDFLLLRKMERDERKGEVVRLADDILRGGVRKFVDRHGLIDDRGKRLELNFSRCRPTFGTRLYARTRDVRKVQQALGHVSAKTTVRHYVHPSEEAERNHAFAGQAYVGWASSNDDGKAAQLAADGKIPLEHAIELLKGGYNTLVARCKNPFRENESVCAKYLPCFSCPQMVVFEDDLWRLFSFYYKLIFERVKMNPNDWDKTYGPVIKVIDNEISPKFDRAVVEAAKQMAQETPHPAWPRGMNET